MTIDLLVEWNCIAKCDPNVRNPDPFEVDVTGTSSESVQG